MTHLQREDFSRICGEISRNYPSLYEEMKPDEVTHLQYFEHHMSLPGNIHALNIGPTLRTAAKFFFVKCGFALHWHATSEMIGQGGAVAVRWFTNFERFTGEYPAHVMNALPKPGALRQGKLHSFKVFEYASATSEDGLFSAHWVGLRQSFAGFAFCHQDAGFFRKGPPREEDIESPGCLKTIPPLGRVKP